MKMVVYFNMYLVDVETNPTVKYLISVWLKQSSEIKLRVKAQGYPPLKKK